MDCFVLYIQITCSAFYVYTGSFQPLSIHRGLIWLTKVIFCHEDQCASKGDTFHFNVVGTEPLSCHVMSTARVYTEKWREQIHRFSQKLWNLFYFLIVQTVVTCTSNNKKPAPVFFFNLFLFKCFLCFISMISSVTRLFELKTQFKPASDLHFCLWQLLGDLAQWSPTFI